MIFDKNTKQGKNNSPTQGKNTKDSPFGISVELHRHGDTVWTDLTPYFSEMTVRQSLSNPWESVSLRLSIYVPEDGRGRGLLNAYAPAPGDWIVVNSFAERHGGPKRRALSLTFVTSVSMSTSTDSEGRIDAFNVYVDSVSWLAATASNQVYVALQARQSVGTFFARDNRTSRLVPISGEGGASSLKVETVRSWDDLIAAMLAGFDSAFDINAVGASLSKAWVALGAMRVPVSLVSQDYIRDGVEEKRGGFIGDLIPVVYNDSTRRQYGPRLTVDPVPGWSMNGLNSIYPQGQSVLDLLTGTFQADTNMVEMYATMEPYDAAEPESGARAGVTALASEASLERMSLSVDDNTADITRVSDGQEGTLYTFDELDVTDESAVASYDATRAKRSALPVGSPASALAEYLGVNPVIVYRVRPWRTEELEAYQLNRSSPVRINAYNGALGLQQIDKNIFRGVTWNRKEGDRIIHGYRIDDAVSGWSAAQRDSDHINCVSVGLPAQTDSAIGFLDEAGLPIKASDSIEQFGLRHFRPVWPFWPVDFNDDAAVSVGVPTDPKVDFLISLYTVALQAMQFMGASDRFVKGSVTLSDFFPEMRPGMTAEINVSAVTAPSAQYLTCYVEEVTHSVTVDRTGKYHASTVIGYSRGAVDSSLYRRQFTVPGGERDPIDGDIPNGDIPNGELA